MTIEKELTFNLLPSGSYYMRTEGPIAYLKITPLTPVLEEEIWKILGSQHGGFIRARVPNSSDGYNLMVSLEKLVEVEELLKRMSWSPANG